MAYRAYERGKIMTERSCKNCEWWDGTPDDNGHEAIGFCRIKSPRFIRAYELMIPGEACENASDIFDEAVWPVTLRNEWCGEFKEVQDG